MAKRYRVYEVQVPGQITRHVACERLEEEGDMLVFIADEMTVFTVSKDECRWWQLTPKQARKPGVTRTRGIALANAVFQVGRLSGKRE